MKPGRCTLARQFAGSDALVFVGAVGIAVRAIAPHCQSKAQDPAVVVLDECGRFAVPILSGHLGGANDLARALAAVCGAVPVITTATDANGLFAVDEWAKAQGCAALEPERIILYDISENYMYDLFSELKLLYGDALKEKLLLCVGSIRDAQRLDEIFARYRPEVVLHAAAHQHVPLMEDCPDQAVKNNVFGTWLTAQAAVRHGVKRFVLISTDKAVNPTNVMGATKYLCEQVLQGLRHGSKTEFAAVRFGNVLGSSGSVIPLFKKQIAYGGPVTITDRRIVRYFMTIAEAVQLVLEAGSFARSGEVFVLDMGQPVYIRELAEKMICLSGLTPGVDIEIQEIGLRPGEKLYEELLISDKNLHRTENAKIFVEQRPEVGRNSMKEKLDRLRAAAESNDAERMVALLHEICPTFRTPEEVNREAEAAMQGAGV